MKLLFFKKEFHCHQNEAVSSFPVAQVPGPCPRTRRAKDKPPDRESRQLVARRRRSGAGGGDAFHLDAAATRFCRRRKSSFVAVVLASSCPDSSGHRAQELRKRLDDGLGPESGRSVLLPGRGVRRQSPSGARR